MNEREINTESKKELSASSGITKGNSRGRGRPKKTDKSEGETKQGKTKNTRKSSKTTGIIPDKQTKKSRQKKEVEQHKGEEKCGADNIKPSKKKCNKVRKPIKRVRRRIRSEEQHKEAIRFLHKRLNETIDNKKIKQYENMINKLEKTTLII